MLSEQEYCRYCGNKDLREPDGSDYCFLIEADTMFGEMLKGILEGDNIPYVAMPLGSGVRTRFALRLERMRIYVTYEFLETAKELVNGILSSNEEDQNAEIKNNIDKLFTLPRNGKKVKKILKIAEDESLTEYCANAIIDADKIINEGRISSCLKGGEYLFVYKGDMQIVLNSVTYEIISVKIIK